MKLKERLICLQCKKTVPQLAFEFPTFGEQQDVIFKTTFGVCYDCYSFLNFMEEDDIEILLRSTDN